MLSSSGAKRAVFVAILLLVAGFIGVQMFYSLTPPRHADHDHAMASLDAGGFLRVEAPDGSRRNLVGRPGRVLVLHFFRPRAAAASEAGQAARFAATLAGDPDVEVLFVATADSWEDVESWALAAGIPAERLYLDASGKTGTLFGVRRWPETLIYDPEGLLVYQSKGPVDWGSAALLGEIRRAKAGVEEID